MSRRWQAALLLAALVGTYQVAARASSSSMPASAGPAARTLTPEERAVESYNSGIAHRDKGLKSEQKAAAAPDADRAKDQQKALDEYQKALKDFSRASELNPQLFQAYNGMGFAYRKAGDFAKALEMYDKALQMAPGFPDAIEYRAEAFLALNRMEDAKQAYLALFASDRHQADILMTAMTDWIARRRADAAGVDPAALTAFESWVKERGALANDTVQMAISQHRSTWQ
jgi:tetratricopeptide (TPR) repeat protein